MNHFHYVKVFGLMLVVLLCGHQPAQAEQQLYDPPAVYLTWIQHPESTMTIQWITPNNRSDDTVEYHPNEETQWQRAVGTHQPMPNGYPYFIHRVELTGLQPATTYTFRPGADGVSYQFRTMPTDLNTPIRFVSGGDVYHEGIELVEEMNRQAALTNPDFALVGGDIAYTAGHYSFFMRLGLKGEKLDRWLEWLKCWKRTMVTPDGRLIPMIPTIGNHEVLGSFDQTPEEARFFYALFAIPSSGYRVLDFGQYMSIVLLDTGHTHPIAGPQTDWLAETLEARQAIPHKFALYHVGAYPSVHSYNTKYSKQVRKYWVPLFEKYGLDVAFEHHDHAYKRTHPIRQDAVDPAGVIYVGDGCWGAEPRTPKTPDQRWYLSKTASTRHVIVVTLDNQQRHFTVLNPKGKVVDQLSLSTTPFSPVKFN